MAIIGSSLVLLMLVAFWPFLNHDVALYLTGGQMVLGGAIPYVDVIDTNPPMILYVSVLPALVALLSGISLSTSGTLFFALLVFLSIFLLHRIAAITLAGQHANYPRLLSLLALLLACTVYLQRDFGQRDHLIAMFILPFVVLRVARHRALTVPSWLALVITVALFTGIAMKPYYIVALLVLEADLLFCSRRFDLLVNSDFRLFAVLGIVYLLPFLVVPEMGEGFANLLPQLLAGYSSFDASFGYTLSLFFRQIDNTLLLIAIVFYCLRHRRLSQLGLSFALTSFVSFLLYLFQSKSWQYHLIPFRYLACAALLSYLTQTRRPKNLEWIITITLITAIPAFTLLHQPSRDFVHRFFAKNGPFSFPKNSFVLAIEELSEPDQSVLFLNTSVHPAFPSLTYTGRPHGGRYIDTFPLAFFFRHSTDYTLDRQWLHYEETFYEQILDDLRTKQPTLIFVNTRKRSQGTSSHFAVSEYLLRRGFFRTIEDCYEFKRSIEGFDVYKNRCHP